MRLLSAISTRSILLTCLVFGGLVAIACAEAQPTLSDEDKQSWSSFKKAMELNGAFVSWMNDLPEGSSNARPDEKEWHSQLARLEEAIDEAESVPDEFLRRILPGLESQWRQTFIPSVSEIYNYYSISLEHLKQGTSPSLESAEGKRLTGRATKAYQLNDDWEDWLAQNRGAISDGVQAQAK